MTDDDGMDPRTRLGQALFRQVAGPDGEQRRARIHDTDGPRWFATDSPIARVHSDAAMFIGGIRALLLQSMHPRAMTAVSEHSGYRGDMWGRLHRTSEFLAVTTFGTIADAEAAIARVRGIHRHIRGTMPDGTAYSADDPDLLRWVHCAEADSFLTAHQHHGDHPLTPAETDEYLAQSALVARALGATRVPTSRRDLDEALAEFRPELAGTDHAREAVRHLLLRPQLPAAARPGYAILVAAAIGLMPSWTRAPLDLPWLPLTERTLGRTLGELSTRTIRWAMAPAAAT